MTTAAQLVGQLGAAGIRLWIDEDNQLRFKAPKGALNTEFKKLISANKADIIDLLKHSKNTESSDDIKPIKRHLGSLYPLTFSQQRFWFLDRLDPGNPSLHIHSCFRVCGPLDLAALNQALSLITKKHESLRTFFCIDEQKKPVQGIVKNVSWNLLEDYDLSHLSKKEQDKHIRDISIKESLQPFSLNQCEASFTPLLRIRVARISQQGAAPEQHILFINMHHIIADGWSVSIFVNDLALAYGKVINNIATNNNKVNDERRIQYIDFAQWQNNHIQSKHIQDQLHYWKTHLSNIEVLNLATDFSRPKQATYHGDSYTTQLGSATNQQLFSYISNSNTSIFVILLATFKLLLQRYTGQNDICIGTTVAGRNQKGVDDIIGCFINLLCIRSKIDNKLSFNDYCQALQQTLLAAQENQDIPFEMVVDALGSQRSLAHTPLFQVLFTFQGKESFSALSMDTLTIETIEQPSQTAKYDLQLHIHEKSTIEVSIEYNRDLFLKETIKSFTRHYSQLLSAILQAPNSAIGELSYINHNDLEALSFDSSNKKNKPSCNIKSLLDTQQASKSNNIAASCGENQISYKELHERANTLAHELIARRIKFSDHVGIFITAGIEYTIALLAVIKSGAAYVPIDIHYPKNRLEHIKNSAKINIIITTTEHSNNFDDANSLLLVDKNINNKNTKSPAIHIPLNAPFYTIFTSGSTGLPKGVTISHSNELNLLIWYLKEYHIEAEDKLLIISSISFDLTQKNILASLAVGAEIVFASSPVYDPKNIIHTIEQKKVSIINSAPSAFYPLIETCERLGKINSLRHLKYVLFGGEIITLEYLSNWILSPYFNANISNMYGPTECSDITTFYKLKDPKQWIGKHIPIGKPIPGVSTYVLDEQLNLVPPGRQGELYIGGESVSLGYINNPTLNKHAFIDNPFGKGLLYKTKDIVRHIRDKQHDDKQLTLEFVCRDDDQIKIRGFRVELSEIASRIMQHKTVKEALALVTKIDGLQQLVIYLIPTSDTINLSDIKSYAKSYLPDYMTPSAYLCVDSWPLTPNGKIDKDALPNAKKSDLLSLPYIAPQTMTEVQLHTIWQNILKTENISIHDNFFDLGGHSLIAVKLVGTIAQEFGVEIPLKDFFGHSDIASLSAIIDQGGNINHLLSHPISKAERSEPIPLSFSQQRLWIIEQISPGNSAYNIPFAIHLKGLFNTQIFEQALRYLLDKQEALRTKIITVDGEPHQCLLDSEDITLCQLDISQSDHPMASAIDILNTEATTPFILDQQPLIRIQLLSLADDEFVFIANIHHIIADAWSMAIIRRQLIDYYLQLQKQDVLTIEPLSHNYADYSLWQRSLLKDNSFDEHINYWLSKLDNVPKQLQMPSDYPRPEQQTFNGAILTKSLSSDIHQFVHEQAKNNGTTLFNILFSIYVILISKHTRQYDICIGTPVSGRQRPEFFDVVGYFINAVILRIKLHSNPCFLTLLEDVQDTALAAYAHQDIAIEQILDRLPLEKNASYPPISQLGFNFIQKDLTEEPRIDGVETSLLELNHVVAKYDLTFIIIEKNNTLEINAEYNTDLYKPSTIEMLLEHFDYLLQTLLNNPAQPINTIDLLHQDLLPEALGINASNIESILPLTATQNDLVISQMINPNSYANTLGYRAELDFLIDPLLWQKACQQVANKQTVPRTKFFHNPLNYGELTYQCVYKHIDIQLNIMDYSETELSGEEVDTIVKGFIYQPEAYKENNLIRYGLIKLTLQRSILLFSSHHALLDGVSIVLIAQETLAFYEALHLKNTDYTYKLEKNNTSYEHIERDRKNTDNKETYAFWKDRLKHCEPTIFKMPPAHKEKKSQIIKNITIGDSLWNNIKSFCRSNRLTPAHLMKLVYGYLIAIYCNASEDFYFTEFRAGRSKHTADDLGCFFQQIPFIFSHKLMQDKANIDDLIDYLHQFQKQTKAYSNISSGLTHKLVKQGQLQFMYNFYHFFPQDQHLIGNPITCIEQPPLMENTVQLVIKDLKKQANIDLYYQDDCFTDFDFLMRFQAILQQLIDGQNILAKLSLLSGAEEQQQLQQWNIATKPHQHFKLVQQSFEHQAAQTPESIAIIDDHRQLSYRELDQQSNQLAYFLKRQGAGNGICIAVYMTQRAEVIIAILAILKAGGHYTPIDTSLPIERIRYMLTAAQVHTVICEKNLADALQQQCKLIIIDEAMVDTPNRPVDELIQHNNIDDLIYTIFTSGSSGKPKSVAISHRGESNLLQWYVKEFLFDQKTTTLICSSLSFDLTQKNVFAPLISGGRIILSDQQHFDSEKILSLIEKYDVTHINIAPSAFYPLVENHTQHNTLNKLEHLIFGGEAINLERIELWLKHENFHTQITNSYGPSECTDISHFFKLPAAVDKDYQPIPLGKNSHNVQSYIMNNYLQLLPAGLTGEIFIAGEGVGHGYSNNEDLNNKTFLPNPWGKGQMYRTGDLAYYDADGNMYFQGRKDFQIKLHGRRIEPEEIQQTIKSLDANVSDVLVLLHNQDLIAYIISHKKSNNEEEWQRILNQKLPTYMLPKHFIFLEKWPLTTNGKINRAALLKLCTKKQTVEYIAPRDEIEERICLIVKNVLGIERVGINDNFFDLGGHSLSASRAIVQIREQFSIDIPVNILFDMTTVEKLAAYIKATQWAKQSHQDDDNHDRDVGFI